MTDAGPSTSSGDAAAPASALRYITASEAASIDAELMGPSGGFSIDQLMELAGLSCAQTVFQTYPPSKYRNVLVACGPGNQGGDGLVAARHLVHFGYTVIVWYPKLGKTELFLRLKKQLENLSVPFASVEQFEDTMQQADVVLDCIFGFSFKGEPREPFKVPLECFKDESRIEFEARLRRPPVISVDIPSGWDVDTGNATGEHFTPEVILSLTAPKRGIRSFTLASSSSAEKPGRHFLGGRFVPPDMEHRLALALPEYPEDSQVVDVTGYGEIDEKEARRRMDRAREAERVEGERMTALAPGQS